MNTRIQELLEAAKTGESGTTSINSARRVFVNEAESAEFFRLVCRRLLDIDEWQQRSSGSDFYLFDEKGTAIEKREMAAGDFIRFSIRGSDRHDWVRVATINQSAPELIISVSPTYDPTSAEPQPEVTAHFFRSEATNNFCAGLDGAAVSVYVIGLEERQNVAETDGWISSIRNVAAAQTGYYTKLQDAMWRDFCVNFLDLSEGQRD